MNRRPALWLLWLPPVMYCLAPVVANRIEPRIFGVPFLIAYLIVVTVLTPIIIAATARRDPRYRANADEPVPVDAAGDHE
jgi:hypothetical protein